MAKMTILRVQKSWKNNFACNALKEKGKVTGHQSALYFFHGEQL